MDNDGRFGMGVHRGCTGPGDDPGRAQGQDGQCACSPLLSHTLRYELRDTSWRKTDAEGEDEPDGQLLYGYNWVLGRKWLLHFSMLPTFVVYNRNNMTVNGERRKAKHIRFNMIFNEHVAIVHNFSSRYFAGATLVMNNSVFDDEAVVVNQNKWRARAFFGLRL